MDYQDKTKEELIKELMELQQKNDSLVKNLAYELSEHRQSEKMFRNFIEKNPLSIQILDMEGYTIEVNSAFTKLFGVEPPKNYSIFKDEQLVKFGEFFEKIKNGEVVNLPNSQYNAHELNPSFPDIPLHLSSIAFTLNDHNEKPEKIVLTHFDITRRKKTEEALRYSEALYKDLVETSQDLIWQCDAQGCYTYLNPAWEQVFGYKLEEMLGRKFTDFQTPENAAKDHIEFLKLIQGNTIKGLESIHIGKAGNEIHLVFNAKFVTDEKGNIIGTRGTAYDITERIRSVALLSESENHYRKMIENSPLGMHFYHLDSNNQLIFSGANPSADKLLQVDNSQFIGKTINEAFPPLAQTEVPERYREAAEKGFLWSTEQIIYDDDKIAGAFEVRAFQTSQGSMVAIFNDISKRKRIEHALLKSEERFALAIDASEQGIWDWNVQTNQVYYSKQWKKQIGYGENELKNEFDTWVEHLHPDDKEYCINAVQEYLRQPVEHFFIEFRFRHKDGSYRWMHNKASSVKNEEGKVVRMFGTHSDITERKQNELLIQEQNKEIEAQNEEYHQINEELNQINHELNIAKQKTEESKERFRLMIKNSNDTFVLINEKGEQFYISDAAERDTGYTIEELKGPIQNVIYPDDLEIVLDSWSNVYTRKEDILRIQYRHKHKYKEYIWYEAVAQNFLDNPIINAVVVNVRDITNIKETEIELRKAKEKAEESDRLKTAFLQNMSHEIRTPMNAIMGFSSLLVENYNNKSKLEKYSEIINQRCNDLLDIINDILDIAKIESGQLPVNIEECCLNDLFSELTGFFTEYQKRIGKQHVQFSLQTSFDPNCNLILADRIKLKQIFINLITNAFKFTNEGYIKGGCKIGENQKLLFYVTDTGIGIPPDKQEIVFERFAQLNQGLSKNIGGTGLGLSIVKGLVGLLGGEVVLESEPGKGSTFSFSIPFKTVEIFPASLLKQDEPEEYRFGNKNILIVEDDFYAAEFLKEVLSSTGAIIFCAINGIEAVKVTASQPIDLVLMDIRLPDMDGYQATYEIRQLKPQLKIIAQTAYASQYERQKAMDAGFNDYISKPINQNLLLSIINKQLQ